MKITHKTIDLKLLVENRGNPRDITEGEIKELADSITQKGQLIPLLVRVLKTVKGDMYLIIDGHRRYRALKKLGLSTADVIVADIDARETEELMLIANLQRKDLHPLEEAKMFAELMPARRGNIEEIAEVVGKSPQYVAQTLVLNNLPDGVLRDYFRDGRLNKTQAMMIARCSPEQRKDIGEYVRRRLVSPGVISTSDLQVEIERWHIDLKKAPFDANSPDIVNDVPACTACPKNSANDLNLFGDLGKKARCLDLACYKAKVKANFEAQKKRLETNGQLVKVTASEWGYNRGKGVLKPGEYEPAKKTDKNAIEALIVDDEKRGMTKWVKLTKKGEKALEQSQKKTERTESRKEETEEEKKKDNKGQQGALVKATKVFADIVAAIRESDAFKALGSITVPAIAARVYDRLMANRLSHYWFTDATYAFILGIPEDTIEKLNDSRWDALERKISLLMERYDLMLRTLQIGSGVQALVLLELEDENPKSWFPDLIKPQLLETAELWGIDWRAICQKHGYAVPKDVLDELDELKGETRDEEPKRKTKKAQ